MNEHDMNERDKLLAEALGGEPTDPARAEALLADDPALAAELESLRTTIETMRRLDERPAAAERPRSTPGGTWRLASRAMRIAALIGLAFAAGWAARGAGVAPAPTPVVVNVPDPAEEGQPRPSDWSRRAAEAYVARQGSSGLGRSLLAIAGAGREEKR